MRRRRRDHERNTRVFRESLLARFGERERVSLCDAKRIVRQVSTRTVHLTASWVPLRKSPGGASVGADAEVLVSIVFFFAKGISRSAFEARASVQPQYRLRILCSGV